eukprot:9686044-Lingulodinium_polyedra.AAC.1
MAPHLDAPEAGMDAINSNGSTFKGHHWGCPLCANVRPLHAVRNGVTDDPGERATRRLRTATQHRSRQSPSGRPPP